MRATSIRYFGDYVLLGEIAAGGMGVVFNARQVSLNRKVAVKLIRTGHLASEAELRRFRLEAEATARLDHPHIVPIYEIGEHEGHPFIAMKLIEGDSLAEWMGKSGAESSAAPPFDPRQAAALIAKLTRAVDHAHQRGVLHRDIKPGNILIDASGEPHLTDFGLAKFLETEAGQSQTVTRAILGTPGYMPPEQTAIGSSQVTAAADIYSLGAVLYALLTGQPPFRGRTNDETIEWVRSREPSPPRSIQPGIDPALETICLKCLEKDPAHRYASAQLLAQDLENWSQGQPILARPPGRWANCTRWMRRHPAVTGLVATAFFGAVVGLTAGLWIGRHSHGVRSQMVSGKMNWVTVPGAAAHTNAQPNRAYRLTGSREVAVTLPPMPAVGDRVRLMGAGSGGWRLLLNSNQVVLTENLGVGLAGRHWVHHEGDRQWTCVTSSGDGTKMAATEFGFRQQGGSIYVSSDGGATWLERGSRRYWNRCALSEDGSTLIAAAAFSRVYISTNLGLTWYSGSERRNWTGLACSTDGQRILATDNGTNVAGGYLYISTNRGLSWFTRESQHNWYHAESSADGQVLAATVGEANVRGEIALGYIYCSSDGGETWTARLSDRPRRWNALAMSPDGNIICAAEDNSGQVPGGRFHISTDSGVTWTARGPSMGWHGLDLSANGDQLISFAWENPTGLNYLMISRDKGFTWTKTDPRQFWVGAASTPDGRRLIAATGHFDKGRGSGLFTSMATSLPGPEGSVTGAAGSVLELRYVGDDRFLVTGGTGTWSVDGAPVQREIPIPDSEDSR